MTENSSKKLDIYKNGKIYRVVCNETGLQCIGSTCITLKQRLQQHKSSYKSYKNGKGNYITSFKIFKNTNYDIVLIEDSPCDKKEQLMVLIVFNVLRFSVLKRTIIMVIHPIIIKIIN